MNANVRRQNRWFVPGLSWIVGAAFLYAGVIKLGAPQDFADSIASFQILPTSLVNPFALSLPPFEILTGLLLLTGCKRRAASLAVLTMTAIFALAMLSALAHGLSVDCGCFGGGTSSRWHLWTSLGRDIALFAAAAVLYRQARREVHFMPS